MNHAHVMVVIYLVAHVVVGILYWGKTVRISGFSVVFAPTFWLYVLHVQDFWRVS